MDLLGQIEQMREQSKRRRTENGARPSEATARSKLREAQPAAEEQINLLVPTICYVGTKDSRGIMDVAVFRLSKKDRRAGEVIHYILPDGHVTVSAGARTSPARGVGSACW